MPVMPDRLSFIAVATSRSTIILPWTSRDTLLGEVANLEGVRAAFQAVGASSPVRLTTEQKGELAVAIDAWANRLEGKSLDLPEGVWKLRDELRDDLNDAAKNET
jgi:hypothetical protein